MDTSQWISIALAVAALILQAIETFKKRREP